jgi:curved DNA-binding protein CbpA
MAAAASVGSLAAMIKEDHYEVLGLSRHATESEVRAAYRTLARVYHPDRTGTSDPVRFKRCAEAFEILSDPARKKAYDESLRSQRRRAELARESEDGLATYSTFYRNNRTLAVAEVRSRLDRQESNGIKIVGVQLVREKVSGASIEVTIQIGGLDADRLSAPELIADFEIVQAAFVALGAGLVERNGPSVGGAERGASQRQRYRIDLGAEPGLIAALDQPENFAHLLSTGEGLHAAKHPIRSGFLLANRLHPSCLEGDFASYLIDVLRNSARWGVVYNTITGKESPAVMLGDCRLPFCFGQGDRGSISSFYKNAIKIVLGRSGGAPAGVVQATVKNGYRGGDVGAYAITQSRVFEELKQRKAVPAEFVGHSFP